MSSQTRTRAARCSRTRTVCSEVYTRLSRRSCFTSNLISSNTSTSVACSIWFWTSISALKICTTTSECTRVSRSRQAGRPLGSSTNSKSQCQLARAAVYPQAMTSTAIHSSWSLLTGTRSRTGKQLRPGHLRSCSRTRQMMKTPVASCSYARLQSATTLCPRSTTKR